MKEKKAKVKGGRLTLHCAQCNGKQLVKVEKIELNVVRLFCEQCGSTISHGLA